MQPIPIVRMFSIVSTLHFPLQCPLTSWRCPLSPNKERLLSFYLKSSLALPGGSWSPFPPLPTLPSESIFFEFLLLKFLNIRTHKQGNSEKKIRMELETLLIQLFNWMWCQFLILYDSFKEIHTTATNARRQNKGDTVYLIQVPKSSVWEREISATFAFLKLFA